MKNLVVSIEQWSLFLSTTTIMITFFFCIFKLCNNKARSNAPPSPWRLPIIGNLHQLGSLPHRSLQSLAKKYGPIMLLHFGCTPTIIVSSAEMAHEVMKTHDLIFASRPPSSMARRLMYDSTDVAFAPYCEYWRQVRRISVVNLLSLKRVQSFRSVREEEVSLFIGKIRAECEGLVNLSDIIVSISNNVVCRVALGRKYVQEGEGYNFGEILKEFVRLLGAFPVVDFIPCLGWIDLVSGLDARVRRIFGDLDGFLERVLDEHICDKGRRSGDCEDSNFVDVLLSLEEKDDKIGISISRDNMKAIILDMFAAGTDTTSTATEWAMAELVRNPKSMKRVQEEVRQVTRAEGKITEASIDRMRYLKAVIKETLRMHPPIPLLVPRETTDDTKLQGYDIPARTRVIVNAWAIGRDPRSWDRPEVFDPDRFMNCDIDFKGQDFELIPFGAGRRGCPGLGFSVATVELTLAHLLLHFDWELPEGMKGEELDMSESPGLAVHKMSSLLLVAKPQFP